MNPCNLFRPHSNRKELCDTCGCIDIEHAPSARRATIPTPDQPKIITVYGKVDDFLFAILVTADGTGCAEMDPVGCGPGSGWPCPETFDIASATE